MGNFLTALYVLLIICVACVIINVAYIYIATKFKLFKGFTKFLTEDLEKSEEDAVYIITPPFSMAVSLIVIGFLTYKLILKPFYYVILYPFVKIWYFITEILFKPIRKNIFKNKIEKW
jgi:hypothetical protein